MFSENLKFLRKKKGLSQEELAVRLNIVRQTVSKWEKGLSVPDADLLVKLADILEVSVAELLGGNIPDCEDTNELAEQLSRINEQLAIKNRRSRRIWKVVLGIIVAFVVINIFFVIVGVISNNSYRQPRPSLLVGNQGATARSTAAPHYYSERGNFHDRR